MSSTIKCPKKKEGKKNKKEKPHESCDILFLTQTRRTKKRKPSKRGIHFSWDERLRLQYYYSRSNGYDKITSPVLPAKIFGKNRRTMSRDIRGGLSHSEYGKQEKKIKTL